MSNPSISDNIPRETWQNFRREGLISENMRKTFLEIEEYCDEEPHKGVKGMLPTWKYGRQLGANAFIACKDGEMYRTELTLGTQTTYEFTQVACWKSTPTTGVWVDVSPNGNSMAGNGRGFCGLLHFPSFSLHAFNVPSFLKSIHIRK